MAMSINNIQMYSKLFSNPLSASESTGYASKIYGAGVASLYGNKINTMAKSELASYLKSFASNSSAVSSAASKLNAASKSNVLNSRAATTSDKEVATATAAAGAEMKTYNVKVDNIAKSQQNKGGVFDAAAVNATGEGKKTFTIESAGKKTDLTIDVKAGYTNRDVMRLASEAINKSNTGVKSRVVEEGNGKISLELNGEKTGGENTFKISDKEGNLASKVGIDKTTTAATDANYSVDGKKATSSTNEIQMGNKKVTTTLKGAGEANITVGQDTKKISKAAEDLAASYNSTMTFLKDNNISSGTNRLAKEMGNAVKFKKSSLESIGMNVGSDGKLSVDTKKFEAAMKSNPDRVKNVLTGADGLSSRLEKISSQATAKPIANLSDLANNSENDIIKQLKLKPMDQVAIQRYSQQGLLFDSMS